ncbi:MAG: crotonase/enoyl-CoA hydratase family protein [Robiginitomaculum sp.]|nr:crotonase/enoyl-CoA hydratase family protein [Robiginitomaculum sp.]
MTSLVTYSTKSGIATIAMDDGKVNALSNDMLDQLNAGFDKAEAAGEVVVFTGRQGMFCAGFDLNIMMQGPEKVLALMEKGGAFSRRLLTFPTPVICAVNGHAMAMGSYLLLACDYCIGVEGNFKIGMNEVAIGMTMPQAGVDIAEARLAAPYVRRAVNNAEIFTPKTALTAGFLHSLVTPNDLQAAAHSKAEQMRKLDMTAFAATKLKSVEPLLDILKHAVEADKQADIFKGT